MILILVSLIISIFRVNSKINILCENVNAFFYQGKNALNLQVEIVLGIISIIILSSLIVLNRIITILFLLNPSLACCFSKVDSVFTFDFFVQYNLVYFDFVRASNSQKSCVWYCSMAKPYQTLVWKSLMGVLFNFVLSNTLHTRNTHALQLSADHQVTALQVVTTSFQHSFISGLPRQSLLLSLTSHGIDPEYMSMIMCNLRGLNFLLCVLKK